MANIVLGIDAGHGMPDPGAVNGELKEYELTLDIATRTASYLTGDFDIVLTRTGPNGLGQTEQYDLAARSRIMNTSGAEFVISFHINAGGGTGPEVYVLPEARPETRQKAEALYKALAKVFGGGRGIKTANFYILRQTIAPAILLEIGFIDNPKDAARLADPAFRDQIATAIAQAIRTIYNKPTTTENWKDKIMAWGQQNLNLDPEHKADDQAPKWFVIEVARRLKEGV